MADVRLTGVRKSYGEANVLSHIDLEVRDGEFMVFVGPSGCGKSTLLRVIAGLEDITAGTLAIGGRTVNDIPPAERGIAMVFQSYALYPHMNLFDNMAFGLKLAKVDPVEIDRLVREAARILNIEHLLMRKPKDLSGGQRQRVAIGRAIVRKPEVFLFDEPLSNLDAALRVKMRFQFAKLHQDLKATMIYVTHDQVEAMTLADRIVVLSAGKIEQVGTPLELYEHPVNRFVAGFIGSPQMNFMDAELVRVEPAGAVVRVPGGETLSVAVAATQVAPGSKVVLGVRPEHLKFTTAGAPNTISGKVAFVESLGSSTQVYASAPGCEEIITTFAGTVAIKAGDAVAIAVDPQQAYLFQGDGPALPRLASTGVMQ
jgi:multiple sugar transport system ATP-binding protein